MEVTITHTRGDTFVRNLEFKDSAGVAIDLTGSSVVFTIKKEIADTEAVLTAQADITDAAEGLATVTVSAEDMLEALPIIRGYKYDVQWTDAGGIVRTPVKGTFDNTFDITTPIPTP